MAKQKPKTVISGVNTGKQTTGNILAQPTLAYLLVGVCLLATFVCYLPSFSNGWTSWDDNAYVLQNELVQKLSFSTLPQFFTTVHVSNYHPFAMLSLALDYKLFGLEPAGFHVHSVILHLINVALVFFFIYMLGRKLWVAFVVALLFGIHPTHVESVAWISERKDLLYVLYYLLAIISYLKFIDSAKQGKYYYLAILFFVFSLLSKGQAVTLPIVLLLIDYYKQRKAEIKLLIEKLPFFLLALGFGIGAVIAQGNAIHTDIEYTLVDRLFIAPHSLLRYLLHALLPLKLSAYYIYPLKANGRLEWSVWLSPLFILALAAGITYFFRRNRVVVFGLLFFLANIILLLQLLPVGGAAMADRYTYLSYTGLFFIIGMGVQWLMEKAPGMKALAVVSVFAVGIFYWAKSQERISIWLNSETLYLDMLSKHPYIASINGNLADYYHGIHRNDLAIQYYSLTLRIDTSRLAIYGNRGVTYQEMGEYEKAMADYRVILAKDTSDPVVMNNYAYNLTFMNGSLDTAATFILKAINKEPANGDYMDTYGWILFKQRKYTSAKAWFEKALANESANKADILYHYALVSDTLGDSSTAQLYYQKAEAARR